jgi:predicted amidophosphoribosyltransferase
VGLSLAARAENVADAFAVSLRHKDELSGKRVLLVDDVTTSGATFGAAASALRHAGAAMVWGAALASPELGADRAPPTQRRV